MTDIEARGSAAAELIHVYVEGWKRGDRAQIISVLHAECVIIECYGPVYRGIETVGAWVDAWFANGSRVDDWQITSLVSGASGAAAEWQFTYTEDGSTATLDGASVWRVREQRIAYLREYQTTAPLYDWRGTWR